MPAHLRTARERRCSSIDRRRKRLEYGVVDMIKLNRIGNKLGLAGAVGVLLAIGMVANQMITESTIAGSTERAERSQRVADSCAHRAYRPANDAARRPRYQVGEDGRRSRKDHRRLATPQGWPSEGTGCRARNRPAAGCQGTGAEDQALMDGYTAAVEELAKAQTTLLAQIDKRSVISAEWTKAVEAQLGSPPWPNWTTVSRSKAAVSGRRKGERAAGGCLAVRRHWRCRSDHGDGARPRPR